MISNVNYLSVITLQDSRLSLQGIGDMTSIRRLPNTMKAQIIS